MGIGGERLSRDWAETVKAVWWRVWTVNWAGLCPISLRMASVFVPGLTWLAPGALRQLLWLRWLWLQSAPAKVSILARPRSIILQNCKTVKLQCKLWTVFSKAGRERAKIMRPAERFVNYALQSAPSLPLWQPLGVAVAVGLSWQPQKFCCTICALTKPKQFNCRQAGAEFPA